MSKKKKESQNSIKFWQIFWGGNSFWILKDYFGMFQLDKII